jgi:hypothetical protein
VPHAGGKAALACMEANGGEGGPDGRSNRHGTAVRVRAPRPERSRLGSSMLHGVMGRTAVKPYVLRLYGKVRQLRVHESTIYGFKYKAASPTLRPTKP